MSMSILIYFQGLRRWPPEGSADSVNPLWIRLWLRLQSVFWSSSVNSWLIGKVPDARKDWQQKEKRESEDEMAGWHHRCNGHELVWKFMFGSLEGGEGQVIQTSIPTSLFKHLQKTIPSIFSQLLLVRVLKLHEGIVPFFPLVSLSPAGLCYDLTKPIYKWPGREVRVDLEWETCGLAVENTLIISSQCWNAAFSLKVKVSCLVVSNCLWPCRL